MTWKVVSFLLNVALAVYGVFLVAEVVSAVQWLSGLFGGR